MFSRKSTLKANHIKLLKEGREAQRAAHFTTASLFVSVDHGDEKAWQRESDADRKGSMYVPPVRSF